MPRSPNDGIGRFGRVPSWWGGRIGPDHWAVLSVLATYADQDGYCQPSQSTIGRQMLRSRPWVSRVISELVEAGLLRKTNRRHSNGGTACCLYRIIQNHDDLAAPDPVTDETPSLSGRGTSPRHGRDTNQTHPEQSPRIAARAQCSIPRSWRPSEDVVLEARRLRPGVDIDLHIARFIARMRAKDYAFREDRLDDVWLSWFLEDEAAEAAKPRTSRPASEWKPTSRKSRPTANDRLEAWGAVAARRSGIRGQA